MILSVKLKTSEHSNDSNYKNKVNAFDFKQLALIFADLDTFNVPVDKAFAEYKKLKEREFPW